MRKKTVKDRRIIWMAYVHRWILPIAAFFLLILFQKKRQVLALGILCVLFSLYSLFGYVCRWRHIYCSFQNSSHEKMTPWKIRWNTVRKRDAYGVPAFFGILGATMILLYFFGAA